MQGHAPIFTLGTPLRCLGTDPGRTVSQDHSRLDLIAILPTRARSSGGAELTLSGQQTGIECGRVNGRHHRIVLTSDFH